MKASSLIAMAMISFGLTACKENRARWEERQIDEFGTELTRIILSGDAEAYSKLWLTPDSVPLNINTKGAAQAPMRSEGLTEDRAGAIKDFTRIAKHVKQQLGGDTDISLSQTEYLIDRHVWLAKDGIFKFKITLHLERAGKKLLVSQWECIMTTQGIRVGDSLEIVDKDGFAVSIKSQ